MQVSKEYCYSNMERLVIKHSNKLSIVNIEKSIGQITIFFFSSEKEKEAVDSEENVLHL